MIDEWIKNTPSGASINDPQISQSSTSQPSTSDRDSVPSANTSRSVKRVAEEDQGNKKKKRRVIRTGCSKYYVYLISLFILYIELSSIQYNVHNS